MLRRNTLNIEIVMLIMVPNTFEFTGLARLYAQVPLE